MKKINTDVNYQLPIKASYTYQQIEGTILFDNNCILLQTT